jgi:Ca2+-binding RTX toxin-like protein
MTMTTFANASASGELLPDGTDSGVLVFPAANAQGGFLVDPNISGAVTSYTMVFDIDVAAANMAGYLALFQTDLTNASDADFFLKKDGSAFGVGISSDYDGAASLGDWHRVAVTVADQGNGTSLMSKYIDGQIVGTQSVDTARFTVADGGFLILTDEDGETGAGLLNSFLFVDKAMTGAEIGSLGGVGAGGILSAAPADAHTVQFDFDGATFVPTLGAGTIIDRSAPQPEPEPDPVSVVDTIEDMMVTPDADDVVIDLSNVFQGEGLTYTVETAEGAVVDATIVDGKLTLDFDELGFSDVRVTATDSDGNVAKDTFRVRVAGENAYTIAVLPDTQDYTSNPGLTHIFGDMTQWLVDQKDTLNIKFVIHVGDVTQNNLSGQWDIAEEALRTLDGEIPYSLLPGNHDQAAGGTAADHSSVYLDSRFSPENQEATNPDNFGGVYDQEPESARNSYSTFTGEDGTNWLVLSMEFGMRDDVIRWASDVIEDHLDHRVIIVSHALTDYAGRHDSLGAPLYDEGAGYDYGIGRDPEGANDGETVYRELIAKYPNITMTFSGHIFGDGAETNVSYSQYGNPTYEFLVNYQNGISREITGNGNESLGNNGGNGAMRLIVIDPDNNTISTETYFTEFDDYLDGYRVKPETDRDGLTGEYRGHQETFTDVDVGTPELYALAKAGDDMFVDAADGAKTASVTLNAAGSLNPNGDDLAYAWIDENGDVIATGAAPSVEFGLGKHELTLQITDAKGTVTTDQVLVVVRGDDTLLSDNFNDGDADGWVTGPDQGVEITVGAPADYGVPALSADDQVAFVPALSNGEKFFLAPLPGVPSGTVITSYTLIYDLYVPKATASHFTSLFQTDIGNASDGELFIRTNADGTGGIGISGDYTGAFQYDAWQRLAFTFTDNGDGSLTLAKYINGVLVGTQSVAADRFGLDISKGALMFSDEDGENSPLYVSSLLVTDKVYSATEIAALGGATAGGIAPTQPTIYSTQFDFSTPDLAPTYGPATLGLTQGGETGAFLLKGTVFSRPDAEDGMPAPEAALWDMSDAEGNKLVWSGEGSQDWSDYVFEAGITSMDNDTIGLIFYYQDDENCYRFTMDGETNRRQLVKVQNGVETVLAETHMGYQFNVELKIKMVVVDNVINVFVDEKNVFDGPVVDAITPLDHGTVGLYSSGQRSTIFDDVVVTRADLSAQAGEDQRVFDIDGDGKAAVTLAGDGSFGLADIVSWTWTNADGDVVATGKTPTVELAAGSHALTLTVADVSGKTASDRVNVDVVAKDKLLVSENFSADASLAKWTIVDEGEFGGNGPNGTASEWLIQDGRLVQTSDLQSRELTWDGATNADYWQRGWSPLGDGVNVLRVGTYALWNSPSALQWDDYSIQATIKTPDNDGLGFLFHYTDAKNYYKLELDAEGTLDRDPSNGAGSIFNLIRMRDGIEEILGQVPGKYEPGEDFTLRVDIVGNRITAYINGDTIFAYAIEDHGNEKGTVGLYSWGNAGLTFDDVLVVDLTAGEPPIDGDIVGTLGDDVLGGGEGDDVISGLAGNDRLSGDAGDDQISGGDGNDVLDGGDGDDTIDGGAGDDVLVGGAGDDEVDGGDGTDTVSYTGDAAGITVDLSTGETNGGDAGADALARIENVIGGAGNDALTGDDAANVLDGSAGNDTIDGGANDDVLVGGEGADVLAGGDGDDVLRGGAGDDTVAGGAGFDTLDLSDATGAISLDMTAGRASGVGIGTDTFTGIEAFRFGAGNDVVTGGNGDEIFDGGASNDTLKGGAGDDQLAGGEGSDTVDGGSGDDIVAGGAGNDALKGGSGDDEVDGGDGIDDIDGGSGDDIITAGAGNDIVIGGSGDDVITGGAGNDTLTGGSGHDVFIFAAGFGRDTIKDFGLTGSSSDVIEFSSDLFDDFADVMSHATQAGADVLIAVDADTTLTLANIKLSALATDDFRFA